tara:strand:+ start:53 stop:1309 length:1257 start_codon:yes stop_codon:yes gene_type:complete
MKKQWIGLLDCNNFFVSCERLFRPELKNVPVLVLSSNDGCVVARSKEVKDIGVPMGVPYFKIKDIVKKEGIVTFSSHLALYRDISKRVFEVVKRELANVEQYSVDEAFFTLPPEAEVEDIANNLRSIILQEVGIPVSIGVSLTKTQAKYANAVAKKGVGVRVIGETEWDGLVDGIRLAEIWGLGASSELNYRSHGLKTVADLTALDRSVVAKLFGINGLRIQSELRSEPALLIEQGDRKQKSILSSRSFKVETKELAVLQDAVAYHVRHVAEDLRRIAKETLNIRVYLGTNRHGDFLLRGGSDETIFINPTSDTLSLMKVASNLVERLYEPDVPYKKVGVSLSNLVPAGGSQTTMFNDCKEEDRRDLMSSIDILNEKADSELVQIGSRLKKAEWQSRSETRSPAYTTQWSDLKRVKAR